MTDNVVTLRGDPLQTVATLADRLKENYENGKFKHVVMVIERHDGFTEIVYDRQTHSNIVFAAAALQSQALVLASQAVVDE